MATKNALDLLQDVWSASSVAEKLTRAAMKQINSILLFTILFVATVIFSGLTLAKGGLYLGKHESDILHLLDILQRMRLGYDIHVDFETPLGIMSFAPILWVSNFGFDLGMGFAGAQLGLALLLLPALWWIGVSRLGAVGAVFFGISILAIATAMVDGQTDASSSISVHYNRWSWALALTALAMAVIQPQDKSKHRPLFEGIVIGLFMAILALMKVTYFVGFALPIVAGLLVYKNYRALAVAFATGIIVAALTTVLIGFDFWGAYLGDLLRVSASENRPYPGVSLSDLVASPRFLAISAVAFMGCVTLRQSGQNREAVLLLLCFPGFYYVTFQNYGNDPVWLVFLVVFLMTNRPEREVRNGLGWEVRGAAAVFAGIALALFAPIYLNIFTSHLHHFSVNTKNYAPFLPDVASDIQTANVRSKQVTVIRRLKAEESGLQGFITEEDGKLPFELAGLSFPDCQLKVGAVATVLAIGSELKSIVPAQGSSLFVADVNSPHWTVAGMLPAQGSAPWFYGGIPGFENAEYLLVPKCPAMLSVRNAILKSILELDATSFEPVLETPLYGFFRIDR